MGSPSKGFPVFSAYGSHSPPKGPHLSLGRNSPAFFAVPAKGHTHKRPPGSRVLRLLTAACLASLLVVLLYMQVSKPLAAGQCSVNSNFEAHHVIVRMPSKFSSKCVSSCYAECLLHPVHHPGCRQGFTSVLQPGTGTGIRVRGPQWCSLKWQLPILLLPSDSGFS